MEQEQSPSEYDKMLQQQRAADPNAQYADQMRDEKISNVISQLDPQVLVVEIEHRLRGEKYDIPTQTWVPIGKDVLVVHEKLISRLTSLLGSVLNQNTTLSNYSASEINNRMELIIEYIRDDLADNDKEYNLEGKYTEMTRIGMIICETVSSVFRRALNGMESKRIFSSLNVTANLTGPEQRGTIKDALQFWK